jgi:curved DNA-binding protein
VSERSLYDILGVARDADADAIRAAYRALARKYHPDVNPGDAAAEERFKEVSAAHDVLSSPEKRALYDEFGEVATRAGFDPEQARAYRRWDEQAAQARGGGFRFEGDVDLADLFGDLLGRRSGSVFGRRARGPQRRVHVEAELTVGLVEAAQGTQRSFRLDRPGEGSVSIDVRVPAGTEDGQKLRLAGQGGAGSHGGPAGDLLLTVRVAPHRVFRREGRDLHLDLPVTVREAMFGGAVEVPTLHGDVELKIPAGSNSGRALRLRGQGFPARRGAPGDLYVHLQVHVPAADPTLRDAAEALDAHYGDDLRCALREAV